MKALVWFFALVILLAQIDVPYERIRNADKEPGNWLTYSRNFTGKRYSPLDQINAGNVGKLRMAWMRQAGELDAARRDSNSIDQRDRYVLLNDLARMREFRARGGFDRGWYDPYDGR